MHRLLFRKRKHAGTRGEARAACFGKVFVCMLQRDRAPWIAYPMKDEVLMLSASSAYYAYTYICICTCEDSVYTYFLAPSCTRILRSCVYSKGDTNFKLLVDAVLARNEKSIRISR